MTDFYGCGIHRTDNATELRVRSERNGGRLMMGVVYEHDGQMHAVFDGGSLSVCHTSIATDGWCPEVVTLEPAKVHATSPLEAWSFHCPECGLRGGFADNTFVRRFVAPPERPPIDGYPLFRRWLHNIKTLQVQQEHREQDGKERS